MNSFEWTFYIKDLAKDKSKIESVFFDAKKIIVLIKTNDITSRRVRFLSD